jgi:hypothetical protein
MAIVALSVALVALVIAIIALGLVIIIYREAFVNRNLERPITETASERNSGEQRFATRTVNATKQPVSSSFFNAPDIAPETLAPLLGRPPLPKGGFGTKVVSKRNS